MTPPPCIIDIEASGLGKGSYPIEIGLVTATGRRYCRLIEPAKHWTHWDYAAESLHNISRPLLQACGYKPRQIALELNALLGNSRVYSDGWVVDEPWIIRLFEEAKLPQSFAFYDIQTILTEAQMCIWHEEKESVIKELHLPRHRATNDAVIVQETYIRTKSLTHHEYLTQKRFGM